MAVFSFGRAAIDGCRIALFDTGRTGSPTVLFVHGMGGAKTIWTPVLDRLPNSWRLIAYDYRGGGESEEVESGPLSVEQWSDDLRKLLDERGAEPPVVLVGHSLGATIVLQFMLDFPEVADAIVLIGADAAVCRFGSIMQERARVIAEGGIDAWVEGPWRAAPPFSKRTQADRPELINEYSKMLYLTGPQRYIRAVGAIAKSPDFTGRLFEIEVPALVLIGGEDRSSTPAVGRAVVGGLPRGEGVEIPDVGHTLPYEAPERVAAEIMRFVEKHALARTR